MDVNLNEVLRWIVSHGLALLVGAVTLLLIYQFTRPVIHRVVPGLLKAQATHLPAGSISRDEMDKRASTIEDLLDKLLRAAVLAGMVAVVLAVFDLWSVLAGIVLIVAAITLASQEVVLDYVMGLLILIEGPYFKGDWITVGGPPAGLQGEVLEIGLRRTVLRDSLGAVNSVSNGLIRASSNVTRIFSVAVIEVQVLRARDVERAIAAVAQVVDAIRDDPAWSDRFPTDAQTDTWVTALTIDGAAIRLQQRVLTGSQMPVASELRRRLASAFVNESIGTARWDTPMPIVSEGPASAGSTAHGDVDHDTPATEPRPRAQRDSRTSQSQSPA